MNKGKSIQELAAELDHRAALKHDVVAPAESIFLRPDDDSVHLDVVGDGEYDVNDNAHRQLASVTNIPMGYYDRLRESDSAMLAGNVNHWLHNSGRRHMVRTLDGEARAILSDRYLRIENETIAAEILPVLYDMENVIPLASQVTDKRLYMKFLFPDLEADITGKGDTVKAGVVVTNSEVGSGQYKLNGFFYRNYCLNGCTFGTKDMGLEFARRHLGSQVDIGTAELFSNATVRKNHEAIVSASVDILKYISSPESFEIMATRLRETATGATIAPEAVPQAVEVLGKEYGLNVGERTQMLGNLIEGGNFSRWSAINSITKIANEVEFDRAYELENIGGKIIDLTQAQWSRVVEQAELQVAA